MTQSDFLQYLATAGNGASENGRIPSLGDLSQEMGLSVAKLREQLEAARMLGLVEVRPRTGIRRKPYRFAPAVTQSLLYAVSRKNSRFEDYARLRIEVEAAFWKDAVCSLEESQIQALKDLVEKAWTELDGDPIIIPHQQHRDFHLTIFSRLDNPFVFGILEAYWNAYEAVHLNSYADLSYLRQVWDYHQKIADLIAAGDAEGSLKAFIDHTKLLKTRP